jgi:ribosomal protein S19
MPIVAAHKAQPIKAWIRRMAILEAFIISSPEGGFEGNFHIVKK